MHRLSSQDTSFLHFEDAVSHMHIGSVAVMEAPPPTYQEIERMVAAKLPRIPRYRQRVRFLPLALGRPVWVDDPHFHLRYHLRRTALPQPGGDAELRNLVGRVMSNQLDRERPLWEMWVIEGLDDDRWAILTKVHHCMVDGVSGAELMSAVLDEEPDPDLPEPPDWEPERQPSGAELALRALAERAASPVEGIRDLGQALTSPGRLAEEARETAQGLLKMAGVLRPPPESSLNGPIGPHRRWSWARSNLDEVKEIRTALGGTVNDVLLAAITGGFRTLLLEREEPADRVVRSLVPVSVRSAQEHGQYNNRVSAMFADLPVHIAHPVERLGAIRIQMEDLKHSHEAVAGDVLVGLSGFAPAMLLSLGLRTATRLPQRAVQTVTTNVPGPQRTLYAVGRRMVECMPYVPLAGHVRMGVAIFSYDGGLRFGVTGDYDRAADIDVLCRGIEDAVGELRAAAREVGAERPSAARPPTHAHAERRART